MTLLCVGCLNTKQCHLSFEVMVFLLILLCNTEGMWRCTVGRVPRVAMTQCGDDPAHSRSVHLLIYWLGRNGAIF